MVDDGRRRPVDLVDDEAVRPLVLAVDGAHLRGRVQLGPEGLQRPVVGGVHLDDVVTGVVGDHVGEGRLSESLTKSTRTLHLLDSRYSVNSQHYVQE